MKYIITDEQVEAAPCYLVAVPLYMIPIVAGTLDILTKRYVWADDDSHRLGYDAIGRIRGCMMRVCVDDITDKMDGIYRLIDAGLFGTVYEVQSNGTVTPPIPLVKDPTIFDADYGAMAQLVSIKQLLENQLAGIDTPKYAINPTIKQLLVDLLAAAQSDTTLEPEMLAELVRIAGLLA